MSIGNRSTALGNDKVAWHDQVLWHARQKRDKAVRQVAEWEELRELASKIKDHSLSKLNEYLVEFEKNAVSNGAKVHWAKDAREHNEIISSILQKHFARRVVKSKSMLTEECQLNQHLEDLGFEVVDTDLGERIIQLREESPSHIVAPAIHLKKEEISETFHQKMGTESGNSNPAYLTEAARMDLRKKFLDADAAITGVNFAIAETGGVVVVTNEGNADMGVHAAPVQIHCLGIEKIIPKIEHLAVFTRLLARSATGQPISIYTSHHHTAKPGGEIHFVIVDNGRSRQLAKEEYRSALKCIRCGACMNTCPVYRRTGGHSYQATIPGPIGSILTPNIDRKRYSQLPFASSLCGSCSDVCPVKIDIHEQLYRWRQLIQSSDNGSKLQKLFSKKVAKILSHENQFDRYGKIMKIGLKVLPGIVIKNPWNNWTKGRELPEIPSESFKAWYLRVKS